MKNNSIISQIKKLKEEKTLLFQHYIMTNDWLLYDSIYKNLSDEELIERSDEIIKIQFEYLDKWLLNNLNIKIDKSNYQISEKIDDWVREYLIDEIFIVDKEYLKNKN